MPVHPIEPSTVREETHVVPLLTETLRVETRTVPTGQVTVRIVPATKTGTVDVTLTDTRAMIERVAIGRYVDAHPGTRQDGDVTIIPVIEERAVVTTRLYLVEEMHVRRVSTTRTERVELALRSEDVVVERQSPDEIPTF